MVLLNYSMNGTALLAAINSNISELQNKAKGYSDAITVDAGELYSDLITSINNAVDDTIKTSTGREKTVTDVSVDAGMLIPELTVNLIAVDGQVDSFLADDCPVFFKIKQLFDLDGGLAKIIAQTDNYKLAANADNNTLLFSDDCGETWGYTIAFPNAVNMRMAWIFKNGNIIFSTKIDNKVYFSDDKLSTLTEIIVYDTDGITPLVFHTPVDSDYNGIYFGALIPESYIIDDVEMLVFGDYWQPLDDIGAGATPVNIYDVRDNGSMKAIYKFGDNTEERDDGTATAGVTAGTGIVGDITNSTVAHHVHYISYNEANNKWYFQIGDAETNNEINLIEATYNSMSDEWAFTVHDMNILGDDVLRMAGARFTPAGDVIWVSDGPDKGGIYKCSLANYTSKSLVNHTCLFRSTEDFPISRGDCISISEYAKHMIACRYTKNPGIICSNDYGLTWTEMPNDYIVLQISQGSINGTRRIFKKDSDGYNLLQWSSLASQCTTNNCLVKAYSKP